MLLWGILFAVFVLGEIAIPALVSLWFAMAAFLLIPISLFVTDLIMQLVIFSILSLLFVVFFRRLFKPLLKNKDTLRVEEVVIEKVIDEREGHFSYDVRYKGGSWSALSKEPFLVGDRVYIKQFEGNKIILGKKV